MLTRRWALSIAVLLMALPTTLLAQAGTIAGKVVDRATRQPLAGARP